MDCCAVGRKLSSSRIASPSLIARQMANMAIGRLKMGEKRALAVFCFDSSCHHHPMREVCSQNGTILQRQLFSKKQTKLIQGKWYLLEEIIQVF